MYVLVILFWRPARNKAQVHGVIQMSIFRIAECAIWSKQTTQKREAEHRASAEGNSEGVAVILRRGSGRDGRRVDPFHQSTVSTGSREILRAVFSKSSLSNMAQYSDATPRKGVQGLFRFITRMDGWMD